MQRQRKFNLIDRFSVVLTANDKGVYQNTGMDFIMDNTNIKRLTSFLFTIPIVKDNQEDVAKRGIEEAISTRKPYLIERLQTLSQLPKNTKILGLERKTEEWVQAEIAKIERAFEYIENGTQKIITRLNEAREGMIELGGIKTLERESQRANQDKELLISTLNNSKIFNRSFQDLMMLTDGAILIGDKEGPNMSENSDVEIYKGQNVFKIGSKTLDGIRDSQPTLFGNVVMSYAWQVALNLPDNFFNKNTAGALRKESREFSKRIGKYDKNVGTTIPQSQRVPTVYGLIHTPKVFNSAKRHFPLTAKVIEQFNKYFDNVLNKYHPFMVEQPTLEDVRLSKNEDLRTLVENTEELLKQPFSEAPPFNRFKASLVPNPPKHPIKITLGNVAGEAREILIATNEPNYNKAIELKKGLQSHFLSKQEITPFRTITKSGERGFLIDDPLPNQVPLNSEIYNNRGMASLKVTYVEGNELYSVSFSLGLLDTTNNETQIEKRKEIILNYLEEVRNKIPEEFVSKADVFENLKNTLKVEGLPERWEKREQINVGGFEKKTKIYFPVSGNQETYLLPVTIEYEPGGMNPGWRMITGIEIDGEQVKGVMPNLFISKADIAEGRAKLIAEDLVGRFKELAENFPEMKWEKEANGKLVERNIDTSDNRAKATYEVLQMVIDNTKNYKHDLAARLISSKEKGDKILFKVGTFRGNLDSVNEAVNYPKDRPIEQVFSVNKKNAEQIDKFVTEIDKTLMLAATEKYKTEAISAAMEDSGRIDNTKTPAGYSPITIDNMFKDAVQTHLASFPAINTSSESFVSRTQGDKFR